MLKYITDKDNTYRFESDKTVVNIKTNEECKIIIKGFYEKLLIFTKKGIETVIKSEAYPELIVLSEFRRLYKPDDLEIVITKNNIKVNLISDIWNGQAMATYYIDIQTGRALNLTVFGTTMVNLLKRVLDSAECSTTSNIIMQEDKLAVNIKEINFQFDINELLARHYIMENAPTLRPYTDLTFTDKDRDQQISIKMENSADYGTIVLNGTHSYRFSIVNSRITNIVKGEK